MSNFPATIEGLRSSRTRAESSNPIDAPLVEKGWCSQGAKAALKRLGLNAAAWVDVMRDFGDSFFMMVGSAEEIKAECKRRKRVTNPSRKMVVHGEEWAVAC